MNYCHCKTKSPPQSFKWVTCKSCNATFAIIRLTRIPGTFPLLIVALLCLAACAREPDKDPCAVKPTIDQTKPGVLIVGDSISLGYTPFVKLSNADVVHSACNDMSSSNGVAHSGEWVSYRARWAVITFNHGFWDIPPNEQSSTLANYSANLKIEAGNYLAHADHVVFVLTTRVGSAWTVFPNSTVDAYNEAARATMAELHIPVLDLNAVSATIPNEYDASGIHWNQNGYSVLGQAIAGAVACFLPASPPFDQVPPNCQAGLPPFNQVPP